MCDGLHIVTERYEYSKVIIIDLFAYMGPQGQVNHIAEVYKSISKQNQSTESKFASIRETW